MGKKKQRTTFFSKFYSLIASFIELIAPIGQAGIDFLGMKEILSATIISAAISTILLELGVSSATIPIIFIVVAAIIGVIAGVENWALSVQATKAMLNNYTGPVLEKSWQEYKASIKKAEGFSQTTKVIFKPLLWKITPDFIFKLYFLYKSRNTTHTQLLEESEQNINEIYFNILPTTTWTWWEVWKERVKQESWLVSLFKPILKILGPVAAGASYVMGLLGVFSLFPSIYNVTVSMFGLQVPILVVLACTLMFVIAALQNRSLEVNRSLYRMHGGWKRLVLAAKSIYSKKGLLVLTPKDNKELSEVIITTNKEENTIEIDIINKNDNNQKKEINAEIEHTYEVEIPIENIKLEHKDIEEIIKLHINWQNNEKNHLYEINKTSIELSEKARIRLKEKLKKNALIKKLHWQVTSKQIAQNTINIAINLQNFDISEERILDKNALVISYKKNFFERLLPGILGIFLMSFGPLVATGTAMLGMVLILNLLMPQHFVLSMILGAILGVVAAIQNFCLEGEESINLLTKAGRALDTYVSNLKQKSSTTNKKTFNQKLQTIFPNGLWFLIPKIFLKIGTNIYLKNKKGKINEKNLPNIVKLMRKKGWLRVTLGALVGVGGPLAHGAEAYRAILLGIFASLGFASAISFPPWVIAIAAVGFVVCMIQNRALEVKESYEKIDELDKKLETFVKKHKSAFVLSLLFGICVGGLLPITLILTGVLALSNLAIVGITLFSIFTCSIVAVKIAYKRSTKKDNVTKLKSGLGDEFCSINAEIKQLGKKFCTNNNKIVILDDDIINMHDYKQSVAKNFFYQNPLNVENSLKIEDALVPTLTKNWLLPRCCLLRKAIQNEYLHI